MSTKIEAKVKASAGVALVAAFVVGWAVHQVPFLAGESELLQDVVAGVITGLLSGAAGWIVKHTPRPVSNDQTPRPYRAGR